MRLTDRQKRVLERIRRAGRLRLPLWNWRGRDAAEKLRQLGLVRWNNGWEVVDKKAEVDVVDAPELPFSEFLKQH